ncbi:acetyltransferase [Candidatus Acetothermia bacterium]|nr:acetyltransferase [Candidatus Acetothermia bacterium]MBI3643975.1 acetyltransferase [Candidatus Acetothermia bacterium]
MSSKEKKELLVYGARGHAKVVIDTAEKHNIYSIVGILDDDSDLHNKPFFGYPVLGGFQLIQRQVDLRAHVIIAIGSNKVREGLSEKIKKLGFPFATIIHPSAQIARGVVVEEGAVIMAGVVINSDSRIGKHVIVNTGATIDHDCQVGDFVHISPGAHLAGNVKVGKSTHIGIGASVIQGITIGDECTIGAGAAVIENIPNHVTAVGVPAKVIQQHR